MKFSHQKLSLWDLETTPGNKQKNYFINMKTLVKMLSYPAVVAWCAYSSVSHIQLRGGLSTRWMKSRLRL